MAEHHPKWTQSDLAKWAYENFQLSKIPSQGTISRLLSKKDVYMNTKDHERDANRIRKQNNFLVRRILQEWISQSRWNNIPMSIHIFQVTAQSIWLKIPAKYREGNGLFSYRWIVNFLSRLNLYAPLFEGNILKAPNIWTFEERDNIKQILTSVPKDDIFTLDETFLAYNLPLDYTQYESSRIQTRIEVITVMLSSNLTGTEKLKPFVVGKYKNYTSFRNYFPDIPADDPSDCNLGKKMAEMFSINYKSNRKSLLTSNMFHDWLVSWDKRLVANGRKIWIVLDDSCSHRIINLRLQNIELVYTSGNRKYLPFTWGVLDEFKIRYRIEQYRALIDLQRRLKPKSTKKRLISFDQSELTMSNAFKFIKKVWDDIPVDTIKSSWKCAGIIPSEFFSIPSSKGLSFKRNEELDQELALACSKLECSEKWNYELLLDLNIENKYKNLLSANELIESAIVDGFEPGYKSKRSNKNIHEHGSWPASETLVDNDTSKSNFIKDFSDDMNDVATFDKFFSENNMLDKNINLFNVSTLIDNPDLFLDQNFDYTTEESPLRETLPTHELLSDNSFIPDIQNSGRNPYFSIQNSIFPGEPLPMQYMINFSAPQSSDPVTFDQNNLKNIKSKEVGNENEPYYKTTHNSFNEALDENLNAIETPGSESENKSLVQSLEFILDHAEKHNKIMFSDQSITEIRSNIAYLKTKIQKPDSKSSSERLIQDGEYLQALLQSQDNIDTSIEGSELNLPSNFDI